jgi:hypothetical protein
MGGRRTTPDALSPCAIRQTSDGEARGKRPARRPSRRQAGLRSDAVAVSEERVCEPPVEAVGYVCVRLRRAGKRVVTVPHSAQPDATHRRNSRRARQSGLVGCCSADERRCREARLGEACSWDVVPARVERREGRDVAVSPRTPRAIRITRRHGEWLVDAASAPVDDCDDAVVAVDADAVAGLDPLGC